MRVCTCYAWVYFNNYYYVEVRMCMGKCIVNYTHLCKLPTFVLVKKKIREPFRLSTKLRPPRTWARHVRTNTSNGILHDSAARAIYAHAWPSLSDPIHCCDWSKWVNVHSLIDRPDRSIGREQRPGQRAISCDTRDAHSIPL